MKNRVLHVIGGLGRGGAPIFIMNNLKYNDNSMIVYDFLTRKNNCAYDSLIKESGGEIYIMPEFPRHFIKNWIEMNRFFKKNAQNYCAIHVHANALIYILPLKLSKKYDIKTRIIHSHNTKAFKSIYEIIHKYNRKKISKYANVFCACGISAGKWMFNNLPFEIVNNAIDIQNFEFNENVRNKVRKELKISNTTTILGHVGRFEIAKNHTFLVDIFYEYLKKNSDAKLLLIGTGSQEEFIREKVGQLKIKEKVIFMGERDDVNQLYQAMDMFVFPSLFEGFPFALIEAQTNGIPCLISDNISNECAVTDLVHSLSLDMEASIWANSIAEYLGRNENVSKYSQIMCEKGYDVKNTSKKLMNIYLGK